jgi:TetR/AcrR family transcriptional repressor of nem operon
MKQLSARAAATREKILQAANDLFYLHGYNGTGLDRIIAKAGVTKGNFYYHFGSKEELATAVLDWHWELALREVDLECILASESPLGALLTLTEGIARRAACSTEECSVRGCFFGNFALELSTGSEAVRHKVKAIFDGIRGVIRELLDKAKAASEVRADLDSEKTAGIILSLMEGAVLLDKAAQSEREIPAAIAFIRRYLNHG